MNRTAFCFLLIFSTVISLWAESEQADPPRNVLVFGPLTWNALLWFPQNLVGVEFAQVSPSDWENHLSHPWVWDNDEFSVNQIGHPYQGSLTYTTARGAGWGFPESLSSTMLGSVSWELFMENERPSRNDLIVTSMGGVSLGEMLFRLSEAARWEEGGKTDSLGRNLLSWALAPGSRMSGLLYEQQAPTRYFPLRFEAGLSGMADLNSGELTESPEGQDAGIEGVGQLNFNLLYGDVPDRGETRPFDVFLLRGEAGLGKDDFYASLFSEGLLGGIPVYAGGGEEDILGIFLHYDFIYNDVINLSANSLGLGYMHGLSQASRWEKGLFYGLYLSFVVNGGTECLFLKFQDMVYGEPEEERRSYDMGVGANGKILVEYSFDRNFTLWGRYYAYWLYFYPAAVPEGGSTGTAWRDLLELGFQKSLGNRMQAEFSFMRGYSRTDYRNRQDAAGDTLGVRMGLSWKLL